MNITTTVNLDKVVTRVIEITTEFYNIKLKDEDIEKIVETITNDEKIVEACKNLITITRQ